MELISEDYIVKYLELLTKTTAIKATSSIYKVKHYFHNETESLHVTSWPDGHYMYNSKGNQSIRRFVKRNASIMEFFTAMDKLWN